MATARRVIIDGHPSTPSEISISYTEHLPSDNVTTLGTILLIHGFPETSYQFRHVLKPLAEAGYRVIAPDYRGAGQSSKPRGGYDKVQMATDLHDLITKHIGVKSKVHVVGHDIGGMVAHAYATRFSADTASVIWGECPLPGSTAYERVIREEAHGGLWHFVFHWQTDLPELLTQGRERIYIKSFYDRLMVNTAALTPADVDYYASVFAQPGAMRAGFDLYRAFHQDARDNRAWLEKHGKCEVPSMSLNGDGSFLAGIAKEQNQEMFETTGDAQVKDSGHWCAEENPEDFVSQVLKWVGRYPIDVEAATDN